MDKYQKTKNTIRSGDDIEFLVYMSTLSSDFDQATTPKLETIMNSMSTDIFSHVEYTNLAELSFDKNACEPNRRLSFDNDDTNEDEKDDMEPEYTIFCASNHAKNR